MEQYEEYYVAFVDILGFKELVKNEVCDKIVNIFEDISENASFAVMKYGEAIVRPRSIKYIIMSDSVVFYTRKNEKNALFGMIAAVKLLSHSLLKQDKPILCRGAITKGDFYCKNNIFFGPSFIEAYLTEENAVDPRIVISEKIVEMDLYEIINDDLTDIFIKEQLVNSVYKEDDYYCVDYIKYHMTVSENKSNGIDNRYFRLKKYFEGVLDDPNIPEKVKKKYVYMLGRIKTWSGEAK